MCVCVCVCKSCNCEMAVRSLSALEVRRHISSIVIVLVGANSCFLCQTCMCVVLVMHDDPESRFWCIHILHLVYTVITPIAPMRGVGDQQISSSHSAVHTDYTKHSWSGVECQCTKWSTETKRLRSLALFRFVPAWLSPTPTRRRVYLSIKYNRVTRIMHSMQYFVTRVFVENFHWV